MTEVGVVPAVPLAVTTSRPRLRDRAKGLLNEVLARVDGAREMVERERRHWGAADLPVHRRIALLLRGYNSYCHALYDLDGKESRGLYVTEWQRAVRSKKPNRGYALVLDDKLLFWLVVGRYSAHVLPILGQVERGYLHEFGPDEQAERRVALADYLDRLDRPVVFKPLDLSHGLGVFFCERRDGGFLVDGEPSDLDTITARLSARPYLVVPEVEAAAYSRAICAQTSNTLRVMTMYDAAAGAGFVARAVHRFGVRATRPVDSWAQGGLSAPIDLATGRLGKACAFPLRSRVTWHTAHPETGAPIEGVAVVNWGRIAAHLRELATRVRFLPYIAWDVIATDDGFTIIEGNARPDIRVVQAHGPLLADPRVAAFYRAHGVV